LTRSSRRCPLTAGGGRGGIHRQQTHRAGGLAFHLGQDGQSAGLALHHDGIKPGTQSRLEGNLAGGLDADLFGQRTQDERAVDLEFSAGAQQGACALGEAFPLLAAGLQQFDAGLAGRRLGAQIGQGLLETGYGGGFVQTLVLQQVQAGAGFFCILAQGGEAGGHIHLALLVHLHRALGFPVFGGQALAAQGVGALLGIQGVQFVLQVGQPHVEVDLFGAQAMQQLACLVHRLFRLGQPRHMVGQLALRGGAVLNGAGQLGFLLAYVRFVLFAAGPRLFRIAGVALGQGLHFLDALNVVAGQFAHAVQFGAGGDRGLHGLAHALLRLLDFRAQTGGVGLRLFDGLVGGLILLDPTGQVLFQGADFGFQRLQALAGGVEIEGAQAAVQFLIALGFAGLALQGDDLPFDFLDDVVQAEQIGLGLLQLAQGLPLVGFEFGDAAGLFEDGAPVFRMRTENFVNTALFHQRIGVGPDAGVHKQALDVLEAAGCFVDEILTLAGAEHAAGDGDLVVFRAQHRFAIGQAQADFGHAQRLVGVGAVEDHVLHLGPAQRLGALLAQHPAQGIRHVALAAAVGPHDGRHAGFELQPGFVCETFEANDF
jgi:hypothetical protein